jgi:hypothetical protein
MKQFEYLTTSVAISERVILWGEPMTDYLNEMGSIGWELIEIKDNRNYKYNPNWCFLFKREK